MVQRAAAVNKAMVELRKLSAEWKVNDALNTRNGPEVTKVLPLTLEFGAEVRVYCEKGGWIGPYKVLVVAPGKVTVDMVNGPVEFAATTSSRITGPRMLCPCQKIIRQLILLLSSIQSRCSHEGAAAPARTLPNT